MIEINRKRLIKTFTDLAALSSPSWREDRVIEYVSRYLKRIGVPFRTFPAGESRNLLARLDGGGRGRPLLFSAHLDTVGPCEGIVPVLSASKIRSSGDTILGSDDKSAVAMFLEGLHRVREEHIPCPVVEVLLSCAEEVGLAGIKLFDTSRLESRRAFVFDSAGSVGSIIIRAPYHVTMDLSVRGRAAHAGIEPEKGISAIRALAEMITLFPAGRLDPETTVNVGIISGGRATNIVAEEAGCKLEARSFTLPRLREVEGTIRSVIKTISAKHGVRFKIERNMEYHGFSLSKNDPVVRTVSRALAAIGAEPSYIESGGGSDTNVLNRAGIKSVNLSCGMRNVHSTGEYILVKDLVKGAELVLAIIAEA